jgi:hypothetical protein
MWCSGLTEVTIPNSVTEIGDRAFYGCSDLKWIESQAATPPTIQSDTFNDYSVPLLAASGDYKTDNRWSNFTNIAVLYTPIGTTFEVDGLRYEVVSVNDLTCRLYAINETVTGENLVIPQSVVYKNRTFTPIEIKGVLVKNDSIVKYISIPNSITTISSGIIFGSTLEKLTINAPITTNLSYGSNIDELVLTPFVKKISNDLSSNTIGKITIEDSETALNTTQLKCVETKEVYLGRNVSESTFKDMTTLEKITISATVTAIRESVFSGCTSVRTVVSHNVTPPTTENPFCDETYLDGVLYVAEESVEAYQNADGWKNFWEVSPLSEYNGVNDVYNDDDTSFSVRDGALHIVGDAPVRVVAINGTVVYSGRGNQDINLNKGMYIVVIGNKASKIVVK